MTPVEVARLEQRRLVPEPPPQAAGQVAEGGLVGPLLQVVGERQEQLDGLPLALEWLERDERLELCARLEPVGGEPDRLDRGDRPARADLDVALDRLDPDRGHGVADQDVDDRGDRAEQRRRPHRPGVAGTAERVASSIGSCPLSWMVALIRAVSSSGRFPSVSMALVSTAITRVRQQVRLADHLHLVGVRLGERPGLDPDASAGSCRAWGRSGRRRPC